MKRLLLLVAAAAFAACGNNPRKTVADRQQDDCVEVLCFYGAKRCATCIAIETGVKEVVETDFAGQVGRPHLHPAGTAGAAGGGAQRAGKRRQGRRRRHVPGDLAGQTVIMERDFPYTEKNGVWEVCFYGI